MYTKTKLGTKRVYRGTWQDTSKYVPNWPSVPTSPFYGTPSDLDTSTTLTFGDNYKDWKERIEEGLEVTTYMHVSSVYYPTNTPTSAWGRVYHPSFGQIWAFGQFGSLLPLLATPAAAASSTDAAYNRAAIDFLQKAKARQRAFTGGVFLGELREAIDMITHPAKALRKGVSACLADVRRRTRGISRYQTHTFVPRPRKGRFGIYRGPDYVWNDQFFPPRKVIVDHGLDYRKAVNKVASDTWLEYAFGWRPLIADVKSAAQAVAKIKYPLSEMVTGKGEDTRLSVSKSTTGNPNFEGQLAYQTSRIDTTEAKYRGKVAVVRPDLDSSQYMRFFGLSWDEVVPTIWELIPYSFLVDYFTNVGDLVTALSYNQSSVLWHYRGYKQTVVDSIFATSYTHNHAGYILHDQSTSLGRAQRVQEWKHRETYQYNLVPTLGFKIPTSGKRWINMAALATSHANVKRELRI